jgi:acetoin utilization protein AcuB
VIAEDLINHMIPPLKGSDDAHKAIVWMEEFRCTYMPVVEDSKLLGFISEAIILETNDIDKTVKDFDLVGVELLCSFGYPLLRHPQSRS